MTAVLTLILIGRKRVPRWSRQSHFVFSSTCDLCYFRFVVCVVVMLVLCQCLYLSVCICGVCVLGCVSVCLFWRFFCLYCLSAAIILFGVSLVLSSVFSSSFTAL